MDQPYPPIAYTARDYASLRQSMIDAIPARMPEWTSRSPQDFGIVMIELFATMGDILSYYSDRLVNEAFLSTATQRDNILKLAASLNYRPRGTAAARASVIFTLDPAQSVVIPAGTLLRSKSVSGDTPVLFSTDIRVDPLLGATTVSVPVTQGFFISLPERIGVSTGKVDQTFVLLQVPVVESSVVIQVEEGPSVSTWTAVNNIIDARPNDNVYSTTIDANGVLMVTFGDGLNGRVPPASSAILASYRVGGGTIGNLAANTLIELADPVPGVLALTNVAPAAGGANAESTESVRLNAPRALQALNRAVTLEDFASLALQVPLVAKARAESAVYNNVLLYVAPFGGGQPSQRLLNDIVGFLATRKLVGVDVVAATPTYVPINVTVRATANPAFTKAQIQGEVEEAIRAELAFDAVDLGSRVSIGSFYNAISSVVGVERVEILKLSQGAEEGVSDIILSPNEIPELGVLAVTTINGIIIGDPTTIGVTNPVLPDASSAPTVEGSRCDPSTIHLELAWTAGGNSTKWFVLVEYLDGTGDPIDSTTIGPFIEEVPLGTTVRFAIDPPQNDDAVSLRLRTQAFNDDAGPVDSPITTWANVCAP